MAAFPKSCLDLGMASTIKHDYVKSPCFPSILTRLARLIFRDSLVEILTRSWPNLAKTAMPLDTSYQATLPWLWMLLVKLAWSKALGNYNGGKNKRFLLFSIEKSFVLLFCSKFIKHGSKIFPSNGAFFYPMFANCIHYVRSRFWTWNFLHQIVANLS